MTSALGQKRTLESGSGMSALPPEADMLITGINAYSLPEADIRQRSGDQDQGGNGPQGASSLPQMLACNRGGH